MACRHYILRNVPARFCNEIEVDALVKHPPLYYVQNLSRHSESRTLRMDINIPAAYVRYSNIITIDVTVAADASVTLDEREKYRH